MSDRLSTATPTPEAAPLTRRTFLIRAALLGSASVTGSGLLTACWPFGDDDDAEEDQEATPTPQVDDATPAPE